MKNVIVKNLYKSYDNQKLDREFVLNNVSFEVEENEFVCILGKSGCGKSTLLNLLAGFIKPNDGEIFVAGHIVNKPSADIGVVFQDHALFPWCTVEENIAFGPNLDKEKKTKSKEITRNLIDMIGLNGYEKEYPSSLSGGMQQRVGIARALATNPDLLLMDEPLGALDALTRENMRQEILKIWEETRKTIVLITHSVKEAVYLANRIIVLKDGNVCLNEKVHISRPRDTNNKEFQNYVNMLEELLLN